MFARAVILAAGTSSRVGRQKLLMEFRGRPLIEHALDAARRWQPVIVAGNEVARHLEARDDVAVVRNDEPNLGMSHSLMLANRAVPPDLAFLVLLGDKPLVNASLIETVRRAGRSADVAYPWRGGEPGHPVWLSPRARHCIADLPAGDTLRLLRERRELTVVAIDCDDAGAFFDLDTSAAFAGAEGTT